MESQKGSGEANILAVEASYRIRLPQPLCRRVGWITGEQPLAAWLLLADSGRCRLLSSTEVGSDPDLQSLKARIAEELSARNTGILEFQSEVSVALTLRLAEIQVTRHETSGWRLTLPRTMAAILQVRPNQSEVAAIFVQDHIELWTIEKLKAAVNAPMIEIV
jgi:hypothetical protein